MEYLTYPPSLLLPPTNSSSSSPSSPFDPPVPLHLLPPALLSLPTTSQEDSDRDRLEEQRAFFAPYHMADLTIPSWIDLARKLAEEKRLWKRFLEAFFVGTGAEKDD